VTSRAVDVSYPLLHAPQNVQPAIQDIAVLKLQLLLETLQS
jgi:hypothetical protein